MTLLHLFLLLRLRVRPAESSLARCTDSRLPLSGSLASVMLSRVSDEGEETFGEEVGEGFFSCHSLRFSLAQELQELI